FSAREMASEAAGAPLLQAAPQEQQASREPVVLCVSAGEAEQKADADAEDLQREALAELFRSTRGEQWANAAGWCSDAPLDAWFGVRCDERGQVVQLQLRSNNLQGPLPESIGRLTSLVNLCLE